MGAPSDALYFVCTGTFKIFRTDEDGYEQVLAFAIRGEVMGFDALCMERYPTAVSALEESSVYVVLKRDVVALTQLVPSFGLSLRLVGRELFDSPMIFLKQFGLQVVSASTRAIFSVKRFFDCANTR